MTETPLTVDSMLQQFQHTIIEWQVLFALIVEFILAPQHLYHFFDA